MLLWLAKEGCPAMFLLKSIDIQAFTLFAKIIFDAILNKLLQATLKT